MIKVQVLKHLPGSEKRRSKGDVKTGGAVEGKRKNHLGKAVRRR